MCKLNKKNGGRRIDPCMKELIKNLNLYTTLNIVSCCCGHGKYSLTLLIKFDEEIIDLFSGKVIPRKKRFYKKDKQGCYYIPEVSKSRELQKKVKGKKTRGKTKRYCLNYDLIYGGKNGKNKRLV